MFWDHWHYLLTKWNGKAAFSFETSFEASEDLSGEYIVEVQGNGKYLHNLGGTGFISTNWQPNDDYVRFILNRRGDNVYEIVNKAQQKKVHPTSDGFFGSHNENLADNDYLFVFAEQEDGSYEITHQATQKKLFEHNEKII